MHFEGANQRLIREHNDQMSLAWHTAWMHRVDVKKFPKLEQLLHHDKPQQARRQSGEEQLAIAQAWMAGRRNKR